MQAKINQLKLNTLDKIEKAKYYCAFSFLFIRPLFKAKLFEYFDYDIKRAFELNSEDLKNISDYYDIAIPKNILKKIDELDIDKCYNEAFEDSEIKLLTYEDDIYPKYLKEIPDFPLSLFYKGNLDEIDFNYALAVVGSRNASMQAKIALNNIISGFMGTNITIISGLAYGIDTQAHLSALNNNLKTIAVIGSGLDIIYPSSNKKLFYDIVNNNGAILSEYPLKTKPLAQNFPQRNRIVTGLSKGTLVGEARLKSGAMISANLTLEYNRELMCIPGNITNPNTEGIYHLIKTGAAIATNSKDVLEQMNWEIKKQKKEDITSNLDDLQKKILESISLDPKTFDEIIDDIKEDISMVMASLTQLELLGIIKQSTNKYYKCI